MSIQRRGFYFSCNADKSANDYTVYVDQESDADTVVMGVRYKNAESNSIYEIIMDTDDLAKFGQMCIDLARQIKP